MKLQEMPTTPSAGSAIALNAATERSREFASPKQLGHRSATTASTLFPFAVFVTRTRRPQSGALLGFAPFPYRVVWIATM